MAFAPSLKPTCCMAATPPSRMPKPQVASSQPSQIMPLLGPAGQGRPPGGCHTRCIGCSRGKTTAGFYLKFSQDST